MNFGDRLAELRKRKGLSQYELARRLSFSRGQIANYEQGKREPDHETIKKIADFFDVSIDYLLGRTDDPTPPSKDDDIGPEPHRNPLGIELTPEQVELLREMRDDPEVLGMFRDFANSTEDERRMMLEIWETIRRRRKNDERRNG